MICIFWLRFSLPGSLAQKSLCKKSNLHRNARHLSIAMDIVTVLENGISPDVNVRTAAELQLREAALSHFDQYLAYLTEALTNTNAKPEVRQLAALNLKNQLTLKDQRVKAGQHQRWIQLGTDLKQKIKADALATLQTPEERVGAAASQLVAAIAEIELPRNEWPTLIPALYENTSSTQAENVRKVSQACIGYICEVSDPNNPAILAQSNGILIAILQGVLQASETSTKVRLTALGALFNSLDFIRQNFEKEGERNYIMQVVCEATQADSSELQAAAFGCLARIMLKYYQFMNIYMEKALYGLTVLGMQLADERVACMAIEFWLTVCEEELDIAARAEEGQTTERLFNFALIALLEVLPTILTLLTRQNEDFDDDDWSVAMAAGACLQLFAQDVGDYLIEPTLNFVGANITLQSWRDREAAVMAFGSILDGPLKEKLSQMIQHILAPILNLMSDDSLQVKETVAWCLGRIADLCFSAIDVPTHLGPILQALLKGLGDHPKVATNCCWTLINILAEVAPEGELMETSPMSSSYMTIIPVLMELLAQQENHYSLRLAAYEALSAFVIHLAADTLGLVEQLATEVLERLKSTTELKQQTMPELEARANCEELQMNILALLTNIIRRLQNQVLGAADQLMELFLQLLLNPDNALIEEDVLMAISAVAAGVGERFVKYMPAFLPFLTQALQNNELQLSVVAVGLVADLAQSLGPNIGQYLEGFMNLLATDLSSESSRRNLRPAIILCFGDVATSVGTSYQPYLKFTMGFCQEAQRTEAPDSLLESTEYIANLREAVLDCYAGIVTAFSTSPGEISEFISAIFEAIHQLLAYDESAVRTAVGLLGDIAAMYPQGHLLQLYLQPWVTDFIRQTRLCPYFDEKTKEAARWARDQQKRQIENH